MNEDTQSYGKILRATSIMGGAAGVTLLLGMVRVKFAAVLIGMAGVGLLASFTAIQGLVGTLAGLGIQSSAVRDVAVALAKQDNESIGRTVLALRRTCWLTGLTGMAALMLLAPLISRITFGHGGYSLDIAALGIVILFANLSGGQIALIQGSRRIGDMARANVIGAALATAAAIGCYVWLGQRGIVPAMVAVSAIQLALSWHFARRVPVPKVAMNWRQTFAEAGGMVSMGLIFMWNGLLVSAVAYLTVMLITQQAGLQAVGLYSAAFALSGIFVNFILGSMSADYYPRLTGVANDHAAVNRLVNEQTEIALLLAAPGLLVMLALAPWIMQLFYSREFLPAVELLQWFVLGCAGRVISWPLGFVMLALGKSRWFFATETAFNTLHVLLIALGLLVLGITGVAVAFFVMYVGYTMAVYLVARHLTGFAWRESCRKIARLTLPALAATFLATLLLPLWPATILGALASIAAAAYSLRGLMQRIGPQHRIVLAACRIPGVRAVCGL